MATGDRDHTKAPRTHDATAFRHRQRPILGGCTRGSRPQVQCRIHDDEAVHVAMRRQIGMDSTRSSLPAVTTSIATPGSNPLVTVRRYRTTCNRGLNRDETLAPAAHTNTAVLTVHPTRGGPNEGYVPGQERQLGGDVAGNDERLTAEATPGEGAGCRDAAITRNADV